MRKLPVLIAMLAVFGSVGLTHQSAQADLQPATAIQDQKSDGECTGHETAGRCADKCPNGYYQQGIDKETGAATCHPNIETNPAYVDTAPSQPVVVDGEVFTGK